MKTRLLLCFVRLLLSFLVGAACAQAGPQSFTTAIWPENKMPGHGAKEPETELPSRAGFSRLTNVSRPDLKLFLVSKNRAVSPAVIVCPGGGYQHVVLDKEGTEIASWLNSLGISGLVLKYRVPSNREGALQDLQRSLRLTRAHAAEWGINPKRVGVIGFSAGGSLAARASTSFGARTYPKIDPIDRLSCRPDFVLLVYPAYLNGKNGQVSPELNLKAKIPPTLIIHSEDDKKYVSGSKTYATALDQTKTPHRLVLYKTGGHGYGLHCTKAAAAWPKAAASWLGGLGVLSSK
ncbi:MAG: alpha/beta hydrolase [Chthoniobacteraceae bacterium]